MTDYSYQVNAVKFNEYASVVVSAGYDRSVRAWDCRSQSTEPIQVCSCPCASFLYLSCFYALTVFDFKFLLIKVTFMTISRSLTLLQTA